jgi:hypothetical protein
MAPKTWGVNETTGIGWCNDTSSDITGAVGTAVGTGSANTTAMLTNAAPFVACTSTAANAVRAYRGGGFSDWFLPSKDELNAMYTYSLVGGFNAATYGFDSNYYWSSSQDVQGGAWLQGFVPDGQVVGFEGNPLRVRPVRAF